MRANLYAMKWTLELPADLLLPGPSSLVTCCNGGCDYKSPAFLPLLSNQTVLSSITDSSLVQLEKPPKVQHPEPKQQEMMEEALKYFT